MYIPKKIVLAIVFLILIVGFLAYFIYRESMFSKEILRLEILGPEKADTGQEIEYTIKYKNNGNFALENPKLIFSLPDYSITEDGKTLITKNLDDIYPGVEEVVKIKARLLGKKGDIKTAKAALSYTPKNLTARYESNTTFTTELNEAPITLEFDAPTKAEKGKSFQYSINYFSNMDYELSGTVLRIEQPSGFDFVSADPSSLDNVEWKLKTLVKAQGGRVNIVDNVSADSGQSVTLKAELGIWQNGNFVALKESTADVQVIQPLLMITQQVNGSSDYIASPGETLNFKIYFRNIGTTPFENLFAVVKIDGSALDLSTLSANRGQVSGNMIVWDSTQASQLRGLYTQEQAEISFSVKVKNNWLPTDPSGDYLITSEVNISQIIQKFTIKVNSGLAISQKAYYKDTNITNTGFIPPKVGESTTYTITWEISNHSGDTKNVKVKATLPKNVLLTGKFMPQSESTNFSFDSASREIVWSVGDIASGTGVYGDPMFLAFQVSLAPTSSQKGSTAQLIGQVQVFGENQFTDTITTAKDSAIDTSLPDDFSNSGGGIVQ